jgi:hypothetical protein
VVGDRTSILLLALPSTSVTGNEKSDDIDWRSLFVDEGREYTIYYRLKIFVGLSIQLIMIKYRAYPYTSVSC